MINFLLITIKMSPFNNKSLIESEDVKRGICYINNFTGGGPKKCTITLKIHD